MYSGTTLTKYSGRVIGAHQRIDRVSRSHLSLILPNDKLFPSIRSILMFEGKNGPDAIKRKSPAKDEPWHYFNPFDDNDSALITSINNHYDTLVKHLKSSNNEGASFEAAWLAHALVDGLTPAHHYPYERELSELRGEGIETRTTIKSKLVIQGDTTIDRLSKNWKMWGPRGLLSAHGMFEIGIATLITPLRFGDAKPKARDLDKLKKIGLIEMFRQVAKEIAVLQMYDNFNKKGWTPKLALQVRKKLGPSIVKVVTLAWYSATAEAGLVKSER